MLLLLSAFITSFDSFIVGLVLGINKVKVPFLSKLFMFIINFITIAFFILLYKYLPIELFNPKVSAFLFLILALSSLKNNEEENNYDKDSNKSISIKEALIIVYSLSIDTTLAALTMVDTYHVLIISLTYSLFTLLFFSMGNRLNNIAIFKRIKHTNIISCLLFIILALIMYFELL